LGQKWLCGDGVTHFWNFVTPNITSTVKARKFKFGTEMNDSQY